MKNTPRLFILASTAALLTACSTSGDRSAATWTRISGDDTGNVQQERAIAQGECLTKAYEIFVERPTPHNTCIGNCFNSSGGIASGFFEGRAARQNKKIGEARDEFYDQCMIGKGWKKQEM